MKNFILGLVVALVIAGVAFVVWNQPVKAPGVGEVNNTPTTTAQTTQVKIALLDTTGSGTGKSVGCDNLVVVTRSVPATTAPLTAAINALYAEPEGTQPSSTYNFIARTKATLKFDHATVVNGTANIYLTGSLSGLAGVCDDPRAAMQLTQTALQFATVTKVQLYLNDVATTLIPSEQ
jgi:hypothetical protein